jgi:oligogalacturonide lyase
MAPERSTYRDPDSGVEVTQLTRYRGHSHHFYFTNSGWYAGGRKLLFGSDRDNRTNLFGVDLEIGEIEAFTDLAAVPPPREVELQKACLNPTRDEVYLWHDTRLLAVDLSTRKVRMLYEVEPGWCLSMTNCAADGAHVYFGIWEDQSAKFTVDLMRGYIGFREIWQAMPLSRIVQVPTEGGKARDVWAEKYWIGHVNSSPTQRHLLTYCHEGPWGDVDHRIWGLDVNSGRTWKVRPVLEGEHVGHEYWYADGLHIGFHGGRKSGPSFLGRVLHDGTGKTEADFPGQTGHIHSNDEKLIVGDGGGVIRLWKWDGKQYLPPRILCRHDSAMRIQQTHPHPRFSPDGSHVVFSSDRSGYGNVYMVRVPAFESLPLTKD